MSYQGVRGWGPRPTDWAVEWDRGTAFERRHSSNLGFVASVQCR